MPEFTAEKVLRLACNPFYAINIDPSLTAEHPPLITREQWVKVNTRMISEVGADQWLNSLLDVLSSKFE